MRLVIGQIFSLIGLVSVGIAGRGARFLAALVVAFGVAGAGNAGDVPRPTVPGWTDIPYQSGKGGSGKYSPAPPQQGANWVDAMEAGRVLGQICIDTCMDVGKARARAQALGFLVQGNTLMHRTHDFRIELGSNHLGAFICQATFLTLDRDSSYFNGVAAHRHLHVSYAHDGKGVLQLKGKNGYGNFTMPTGLGPSYGTVSITLLNNL